MRPEPRILRIKLRCHVTASMTDAGGRIFARLADSEARASLCGSGTAPPLFSPKHEGMCCGFRPNGLCQLCDAGWSSPVARQAHNLKAAGSNPAPATTTSTTLSPNKFDSVPSISTRIGVAAAGSVGWTMMTEMIARAALRNAVLSLRVMLEEAPRDCP